MRLHTGRKGVWRLLFVFAIFVVASVGCASIPLPAATPSTQTQKERAMINAADIIEKTFGETVTPGRMTFEEWTGSRDTIYVGEKETVSYYVHTEHATGVVQNVSRNCDDAPLTEAQRQLAEAYNPFNPANENQTNAESEAQGAAMAEACTPIVRDLIERSFSEGRAILETNLGFCMTDSEIAPLQHVGVRVHMSEGACYTVTVLWPQLTVVELTVYPLGWHSCVYGYFDPLEAVRYPPAKHVTGGAS